MTRQRSAASARCWPTLVRATRVGDGGATLPACLRHYAGQGRHASEPPTHAGLSTVLHLGMTHKTSEMKGTLAYMPPEVFLTDDVSTAMDIYSLGVLSECSSSKEPGARAGEARGARHRGRSGRWPFLARPPLVLLRCSVRDVRETQPAQPRQACPNRVVKGQWQRRDAAAAVCAAAVVPASVPALGACVHLLCAARSAVGRHGGAEAVRAVVRLNTNHSPPRTHTPVCAPTP